MKKIVFMVFFLSLFMAGTEAQELGICFERDTMWKKVLKKAKQERKLVFVDCYTSWCIPCKKMAMEVFVLDSVGSYFNKHFVSVKYDIEKDSVGAALKRRFAITAVPTLLFIEPASANMVHKSVGGLSANQLLDVAEQAIDPEHNLQALKKRYAQGEQGKEFMNELLITLLFAGDKAMQAQVGEEYVNSLNIQDLKDDANWGMFKMFISDPLAASVCMLMDSIEYARKELGREKVDAAIEELYYYASHEMAAWNSVTGGTFDEERNKRMIRYLLKFDHPNVPGMLAELYTAEHVRQNNYRAMLDEMRNVMRFNMFRQGREVAYFHTFMQQLAQCKDMALLQEGIDWVNEEFVKTSDLNLKSNLMKRKAELLQQKGDMISAEIAMKKASMLQQQYIKALQEKMRREAVERKKQNN